MNPHSINPDKATLLRLIEKYFDCRLTDDEEATLRGIIARTCLQHPAIDEARALMGIHRPDAGRRKVKSHRRRLTLLTAAAAAAVVVVAGVMYLRMPSANQGITSQCIAYANGEKITNEEEILRLIAAGLSEAEGCTGEEFDSIERELGDAAPLIDAFETLSIID